MLDKAVDAVGDSAVVDHEVKVSGAAEAIVAMASEAVAVDGVVNTVALADAVASLVP
jgi:hypothetical protein